VQLNGSKADGKTITLNATFTDANEQFTLSIKNGVLNYRKDKRADAADASLTTTRAVLNQLILGETTWQNKLAANEAIVEGSPEKLIEFLSLMDTFEQWFNIVTP
jgi:alkyl sulfatase BDS1-like metallo-beta-lactamase superfamily hydrolase